MIMIMIAILITILFSVWVMNLKHEVQDLERHLYAGPDQPPDHDESAYKGPHHDTGAHHPQPATRYHPPKVDRTGGIPTWTIE